MRGEVCVGAASVLSLTSLLLLIFLNVGQTSTSSVNRGIYMASINASGYGVALEGTLFDPINGLYGTNASAPLAQGNGLRQRYRFGLYGYCGFVNESSHGKCSNQTAARKYHPYDALKADMASNYSSLTDNIFETHKDGHSGFQDSGTLGNYTSSAYYLILLGTICVALSFLLGILRYTYTFLLSSITAVIASIFLLIGAAMWTAMVSKSKDINSLIIGSQHLPLGITVSTGPGIYMLWAAFATMLASVLPYMISCCTYRG